MGEPDLVAVPVGLRFYVFRERLMANPVVGGDRPQRLAGGVPCADRCLVLGADLGSCRHAAQPTGEGCQARRTAQLAAPQAPPAGNLPPPRQPSIAARQRPTLTTKRPAPPSPASPPQGASFTRHRM